MRKHEPCTQTQEERILFSHVHNQTHLPVCRLETPTRCRKRTCMNMCGGRWSSYRKAKTGSNQCQGWDLSCLVLKLWIRRTPVLYDNSLCQMVLKHTEWSTTLSSTLKTFPLPLKRWLTVCRRWKRFKQSFLFGTCSIYFSYFQIKLALFPLECLNSSQLCELCVDPSYNNAKHEHCVKWSTGVR